MTSKRLKPRTKLSPNEVESTKARAVALAKLSSKAKPSRAGSAHANAATPTHTESLTDAS